MYPITSLKSDNQKAVPNFVALTVVPSGSLASSIGRLVKDGVHSHKKKKVSHVREGHYAILGGILDGPMTYFKQGYTIKDT